MFDFLHYKKKIPLAIAAIFRNEKDYILEWLAWHKAQGVEKFIIYDNDSDDGTTEFLEQLEKLKVIDLFHIDRQENAQIKAYEKIIKAYKSKVELIVFIDADEFIVPQDEKTALEHITALFKDASTGAVGINWRVFGTNGHQAQVQSATILSYPLAGNDLQKRNHFIKSIYRPEAVASIFAHRAILNPDYCYLNTLAEELLFSTLKTLPYSTEKNKSTGVSAEIVNSKLRINHYALRSVEEFIKKKKYRGDAIFGKNHVKSDSYFNEFDLNDEIFTINKQHLIEFEKQQKQLSRLFKLG